MQTYLLLFYDCVCNYSAYSLYLSHIFCHGSNKLWGLWGHKLLACITFWPRQHWTQRMEKIILNDHINWFQDKNHFFKKNSGFLFYIILFLVPIIEKVENASGEHVFSGLKSCSIIPKPEEKHVNGLYFKILLY